VKLLGREADQLHLMPSSGKVELYLHFHELLHGVVNNILSAGTALPLPYTMLLLTSAFPPQSETMFHCQAERRIIVLYILIFAFVDGGCHI
jgi:hypothetical protein